jgi:hypothetical protein
MYSTHTIKIIAPVHVQLIHCQTRWKSGWIVPAVLSLTWWRINEIQLDAVWWQRYALQLGHSSSVGCYWNVKYHYWGEPERAPHKRYCTAGMRYIYGTSRISVLHPTQCRSFRIYMYAVLILRLANLHSYLCGLWTWTEAARSNRGSYPCTTVGVIDLE